MIYDKKVVANTRNSRLVSALENLDSKTQGNLGMDKAIPSPLEVTSNDAGALLNRDKEDKISVNTNIENTNIIPHQANYDSVKLNAELERKKQLLNAKLLGIKQKKLTEETKFPSIQDRIKEVQTHFEFHSHEANSINENIGNNINSVAFSSHSDLLEKPVVHKKKKKPTEFVE